MTLREFLEYRKNRFKKEHDWFASDHYKGYREGWHDACRDIIEVLEAHGFDLDVTLD